LGKDRPRVAMTLAEFGMTMAFAALLFALLSGVGLWLRRPVRADGQEAGKR
jgi:hypothetical protein